MKCVSFKASTLLTASVVLSSCGKLPGFTVNPKTDSFKQTAVRNDQIDILFVVDNSGSMVEEQKNLADSFEHFIANFANKDFNFQIGIVSTDNSVNADYWAGKGAFVAGGAMPSPYVDFPNAGPGSLLAYKTNDRILRPSSVDYVRQFEQNVKLGVRGSGAEMGILSATSALSATALQAGSWNEGFVRPGSLLSVIVMSDEDESKSPSSVDYIRAYPDLKKARVDNFKAVVTSLRGEKPDLFRFDAIVARSKAECPTVGSSTPGNIDGTGEVYKEVADFYKGKTLNICQDFSDELNDLGSNLVQFLSRFKLIQKPEGQIEVVVNGVVVPRDATNGWDYLPETQEVEFRGSAIPSANAQISVNYVPGEPLK